MAFGAFYEISLFYIRKKQIIVDGDAMKIALQFFG